MSSSSSSNSSSSGHGFLDVDTKTLPRFGRPYRNSELMVSARRCCY